MLTQTAGVEQVFPHVNGHGAYPFHGLALGTVYKNKYETKRNIRIRDREREPKKRAKYKVESVGKALKDLSHLISQGYEVPFKALMLSLKSLNTE